MANHYDCKYAASCTVKLSACFSTSFSFTYVRCGATLAAHPWICAEAGPSPLRPLQWQTIVIASAVVQRRNGNSVKGGLDEQGGMERSRNRVLPIPQSITDESNDYHIHGNCQNATSSTFILTAMAVVILLLAF
eukprot:57403-Pelagomonas_calceolata.AAC.7